MYVAAIGMRADQTAKLLSSLRRFVEVGGWEAACVCVRRSTSRGWADGTRGCLAVRYCSRACQSKAWANHRVVCQPAQLIEWVWGAFLGPVTELITRLAVERPWDGRRTLVLHLILNRQSDEADLASRRLRLCCATLWPVDWDIGAIASCIHDATGENRTILQAPVPTRHLRIVIQAGPSPTTLEGACDPGHRAHVFLVAVPFGRARATEHIDWGDAFERNGFVGAGAKTIV